MCGAALGPETLAAREERKVVTVLFCDLVGFTAKAEQLDPEEVRAVLRPYHDRVRAELERRGGTVEKFIGDAVMALFGAPTAHEDDPERAVRAALAIRDFARRGRSRAAHRDHDRRGARLTRREPVRGRGDGVGGCRKHRRTASERRSRQRCGRGRDDSTRNASRDRLPRDGTGRSEGKGQANRDLGGGRGARAIRAGSARPRGRQSWSAASEKSVCSETRPRRRARGALAAARDARRRPRHRQEPPTARTLPHRRRRGGAHDLATGQMPRIRGRRDVLGAGRDRESPGRAFSRRTTKTTASEKLRRAAEEIVDSADAEWVAARLRPLAGLEDESELGGSRGTEAFAAWRRFFEELAAQRPLILVFEDLQWADDGLLDFVDELADWVTDVPMLVVCTARPELLARRPNWGGGKLNTSTIALEPLSDVETARLMATLLERSVLPADVQQTLLERAGRQPALRRAVRPAVPRARLGGRPAAPRDVAGHHQRSPRWPARRREGIPPRGSGRREGLLDGRPRQRQRVDSETFVHALVAKGLPATATALVGRRRARARIRARARA